MVKKNLHFHGADMQNAEPVIVRKGQQKLIDKRALGGNLGNYKLQIFKTGKKEHTEKGKIS